jgi:ubiquinone/menaquinone biosynthesis C-methylase UbiE
VPHPTYMFGHSHSELDRLVRQAELLRPITRRLLIDAGVSPGMRVLDIGCGPGDVTLLAAELVGPTGHITGVDRSCEALATARQRAAESLVTNIEFRETDIDSYRGEPFDAVICRYVLIHQTDPVSFLRTCKQLTRPGGIIALHEMDTSRGLHSNPRLPLLHWAEDLVQAAFHQMGTAYDAGARLVELFARADLPTPNLTGSTVVERGEDSLILPWVADTLRTTLPRLIDSGLASAADVDIDNLAVRLQAAAAATDSQIESIPQICGWVRV